MRKTFLFTVATIVTIVSFVLSSFIPGVVQPVYACYNWAIGQRVGLKGGTQIRTGSGFNYSVHTTLPADANNWQVDIINGLRNVDGQEWWDISRKNIDGGGTGWVYKAQAGWDLCGSVTPGNIYVASGLELVPDPNHSWPPYEGDKLIGRFTLGNNGGSAVRITGYGVRMRRNSSDYWDFLNTNAFDLQPGQTVRFDQNNERPLTSGHYRAEITWQVNGGSWQVSNGTEFDVVARPGNLYISSGLELITDPNHTWPPYAGDKLIGRFGLGNNGGSAVRITGYGVRMRRNSSDYWDFLNTNAFDLQSGQTVSFNQNNERPLEVGHYRAEITWQVNGGSWQVSNGTEFDVIARPGSIYVSSGFELITDPNHAWPPFAGDKLIGRFGLGNNGGTTMRITGYGVRMRRNSTDYWDFLNTNAFDLQPGQTVSFNQNNERQLDIGHYRAEISWQVNGGTWQVANAIDFDVSNRPPQPQGHISLQNNQLSLNSVGSGKWPPVGGDKLTASYTLINDGSGSIRLEGYGVRLRLNGWDNWDFLNMTPVDLAPGQTIIFNQNNERGLTSGHYRAEVTWKTGGTWYVTGGHDFDVGTPVVNPPVSGSSGSISLVTPLSVSPLSINTGQNVQGGYRIRNSGSAPISILRIGIGGRGPLGTDIHDFPWHWYITLNPGQEYQFDDQRTFDGPGAYTFFPVYQTHDDIWHEITYDNGASNRVSIIAKYTSAPNTSYKMMVDYDGESGSVLDVTRGYVSKEADGTYSFWEFSITNRSPLCRQFRIRGNGSNLSFGWRDWAVIMPYQTGKSGTINGLSEGQQLEIITDRRGDTPASAFVVGLCNVAVVTFATATGGMLTSETQDVEWMYALMDKIYEIAEDENLPIVELEAIIADFVAGRTMDGIFKLISFNVSHPTILPILLKDWFGWTIQQGRWSIFAKQLVGAWQSGKSIGSGGMALSAMAFESPSRARAVITPLKMPAVTQSNPSPLIESEQIEAALIETLQNAYGTDWAAVQNGGRIVSTSGQVSYAEQANLIDGSLSTSWEFSRVGGKDDFTTVQLASGRTVYLNTIQVQACPSSSCTAGLAPKAFHIDASLDGVNYFTIAVAEFGLNELQSPKTLDVTGQKAQYLRLVVDSSQDSASSTSSIAEFMVYGIPGMAGDAFEPDSVVELAYDFGSLLGFSRLHNVHYPGDYDWFQFKASAGTQYLISTNNLGVYSDTVIQLFGQDKSTILAEDDDSGGGRSSRLVWTAPSDGIYYVRCMQYSSKRFGEGTSYDLQVILAANQVYLPFTTRSGVTVPQTTTITGKVTYQGRPIGNIAVELRFYNGSEYSSKAIVYTQVDGSYWFENISTLRPGERYYVRYLNGQNGNSTDPNYLWLWCSFNIYNYTSAPNAIINGGIFDIQNIAMVSPSHGSALASPYIFQWIPRNTSLTDDYEIFLFDPYGSDVSWTTYPTLDYRSYYSLGNIPSEMVPGKYYAWEIYVNAPDGGYGLAHYHSYFSFDTLPIVTSQNIQSIFGESPVGDLPFNRDEDRVSPGK